jgi:hypothetical protein
MINAAAINAFEINGTGVDGFFVFAVGGVLTRGYEALPLADRGRLLGTDCVPPPRKTAKPRPNPRTVTVGGRRTC